MLRFASGCFSVRPSMTAQRRSRNASAWASDMIRPAFRKPICRNCATCSSVSISILPLPCDPEKANHEDTKNTKDAKGTFEFFVSLWFAVERRRSSSHGRRGWGEIYDLGNLVQRAVEG